LSVCGRTRHRGLHGFVQIALPLDPDGLNEQERISNILERREESITARRRIFT